MKLDRKEVYITIKESLNKAIGDYSSLLNGELIYERQILSEIDRITKGFCKQLRHLYNLNESKKNIKPDLVSKLIWALNHNEEFIIAKNKVDNYIINEQKHYLNIEKRLKHWVKNGNKSGIREKIIKDLTFCFVFDFSFPKLDDKSTKFIDIMFKICKENCE